MSPSPRQRPPDHQPLFRFVLIAGLAAAIIALAASASASRLTFKDEIWLGAVAFVLMLVARRFAVSRIRLGVMAKQALILIGLGAALVAGYSYRSDFGDLAGRAAGTIIPSRGVQTAPGVMRFSADENGQFFVDALVDDFPIHFLVDTGASGIALSQADALHLGFDAPELRYSATFSTANGTTRAAPVTLERLRIGPFSALNIPAWVNEGEMEQSLLGMSYLARLGRVEIRGDTLTLEQGR
jgi:aspartyl protease family protein